MVHSPGPAATSAFHTLLGLTALVMALASPRASAQSIIRGADVSMLPRIEDHGGTFTENGRQRDPLEILGTHGVNVARLRLWHTPSDGYCDLDRTLAMATRIRARGMGFLLDIHYSDTWADPGRQSRPSAWSGVEFAALRDSVYHYTLRVMTALKRNNTLPDMVQIGNEVTCGMLWNDGRVCGASSTPDQWDNFAAILGEGLRGVRESLGPGDSVQTMIHIDRGGNAAAGAWFYDNLVSRGLDFDVIGLSYYPWWHGTLDDLRANLDSLATRFDKDIVVVETAYPWTLGWHDQTHNIVGLPEQLHVGYPATVAGQQAFLEDLLQLVARTPGGRGRGVCYWAPEHISTATFGSPWENLALFDFAGEALGSLAAFEGASTGLPAVRSREH